LIDKAQSGDEEATNTLIYSYQRLILKVFTSMGYQSSYTEDMIQEANLGLWKAIINYDSKFKTKFITYAFNSIKYATLSYLKNYEFKNFPQKDYIQYETSIRRNITPLDYALKMSRNEKIDRALEKLIDEHRLIIEMIYGLNGRKIKLRTEIAKIMGLTKSRISQIESQCLATLKKEYKKL
jgi:RNA polymerase sigma factor (sigma-70 family)